MRAKWVMIFVLGFMFCLFQRTRSHDGIVIGAVAHRAAKVAVQNHNKEMNTDFEFVSIEKAAGDFSYYSTYYLLIKLKDHSQRHMLFQTAVWCIPRINFYSSTGLEYAGEAQPGASLHYPPRPLVLSPRDLSIAEFAVHHHNLKLNSDLELEQVVKFSALKAAVWGGYSSYHFTLTVYDRSLDKHILVESKVVQHEFEHEFYESTGLVYVSDLHSHTHPSPPPFINQRTKMVAEFAVQSHNLKMGTRLEFVDQVGMGMDSHTLGEDLKHQLTIQVIDHLDQGKNKIFKTVVVQKVVGKPELIEFEFVSDTQPRPMAETSMAWVSPTILSKEKEKFTNALVDQHNQLTTRRLSTIADDLRSGRINLKSLPFLCEDSYNLTDHCNMLSMIAELEEFVPLVDGVATSYTVLIPLLTTLAKFEDRFVRETAVTLLCRIGEHMNQKDVILWFIPLIKALATGESYAGRVSSIGVFHIAYLSATTELKAELRMLYSELRRDHMPMVRRAAASNLGKFAATDEVGVLGGAWARQTWGMAQGLVQNLFYNFPAFFNLKI